MAKLSEHQSDKFTKLLYIGDSSTGKTGSLTSLVTAGYDLRILDMDNGLDILKGLIRKENPALLDKVDAETRRDKFKSTQQGVIVDGTPKAFVEATKLLTKWSDDSDPSEWGENTVFVLDSLTALGNAAFEWARGMNPTSKDPRQWYGMGMQAVERIIELLTSENFHTNVIIISHVKYQETQEGITKGYVSALGQALGPILPRYFNNLVLAESSGSGKNVRRRIKTMSTGTIDLKTAAPWTLDADLPLESGLSTLFSTLKSK